MKRQFILLPWLLWLSTASAQQDTLVHRNPEGPRVSAFIAPVAMMGYGFAALKWHALINIDQNIREEIWTDRPHHLVHLDNYLQYSPAAAVYVLNAAGVHGLHDFRDRTVIYIVANAFMGATVLSLKKAINAPRPDGSGNDGFPSGHTATAFLAAEFMRHEFQNRSVWYGIAAYAAATGTGYLRLYNDKHWFSELLAGAGIGMLTAKASYWLFPWVDRNFLPARKKGLYQN